MKLLLRLTPVLLIMAGLFLMGCEETEDDPDHILTGTWDLSNMEQTSSYSVAAGDVSGMPPGMPLGSGTVDWTGFQALGVAATVVLENDFTFTLSGMLPSANDTLGANPNIVTLNDLGTWTAAEDMSTLLIDGGLYDIGGMATYDDIDAPTTISLAYADTSESMKVVYNSLAGIFMDVLVQDASSTVLGFTKQ